MLLVLLIGGVAFYLLVYRKPDSDGLGMFGGGGAIPTTSKVMTLRSARQAAALSLSNGGPLGRQRNVVVNNAFSIPFDDGGDVANEDDAVVAAAAAAAGYLLVTIDDDNDAPGQVDADDGGLPMEDDDATYDMPGAAASSAPITRVFGSASAAAAPLPDYHPTESQVRVIQGGDGAAQCYQNVDNTPWDGEVQIGSRDYQNARSITMVRGHGNNAVPTARSTNNRSASTSSKTPEGYENGIVASKTMRRDGNINGSANPNRTASTNSITLANYENVPTLRKTGRRRGDSSSDATNNNMQEESDDEVLPAVPKKARQTELQQQDRNTSGSDNRTGSNTLERYENVPTLRKTVVRRGKSSSIASDDDEVQLADAFPSLALPASQGRTAEHQPSHTSESNAHDPSTDDDLDDYEVVEVQKFSAQTRQHRPGCKCGGRACKLDAVWWCATCGSEAGVKCTAAEAEACELKHRTMRVLTLRQQPGMLADAIAGYGARMHSAPNDDAATWAAGGGDDAPQMYSAPTDAGETYDGFDPVRGDARMYSQPNENAQTYCAVTDA
jgi:hypothetical protein